MVDPAIALASFAVAVLLALAGYRLLARWRQTRAMTARIRGEDALKHILKCEAESRPATVESVAGSLGISPGDSATLLDRLQAQGLVRTRGTSLHLTSHGRQGALHIVRAHRLWEHHLAEETGFAESEWHRRADRQEHRMSPEEADMLAARLGHPTHDPHGDPIPGATAGPVAPPGRPLNDLAVGDSARIAHVEDEPDVVYAQLVAEGLYPGMTVRVLGASRDRIRIWADGDEHVLAPIVAASVSVTPLVEIPTPDDVGSSLSNLRPGEEGVVLQIAPRCRGPVRQRLLDLGILPGTPIRAELTGFSGEPTAYRVRGTLVALRSEQATAIRVTPAAGTRT